MHDHIQPFRQCLPESPPHCRCALQFGRGRLNGRQQISKPAPQRLHFVANPLEHGLSGSNAALMGPAAALNPSTTPPRNAVMGCQYFQTTSATPASAVTTRPIGLSRAPNRPDMAYRATRSIASGPDASTRSTVPAAASPPRSTARGFINITATARKPDNPDRKSATGAPATVFRTFPVSDAVRRKDDNGAVSKPAALPDEASPALARQCQWCASQPGQRAAGSSYCCRNGR